MLNLDSLRNSFIYRWTEPLRARRFWLMEHVISLWLFRNSPASKQSAAVLEEFNHKYEGRSCFIIGNGPSLKPEDLEILQQKNVVTFASNRIAMIFPHTKWRPTFLCVGDNSILRNNIKLISDTDARYKFFRQDAFFWTKKISGNLVFLNTAEGLGMHKFSADARKEVFTAGSVTYLLLQLAVHMGFKKIYLLGIDMSYAKEKLPDGSIVTNSQAQSYFNGEKNNRTQSVVGFSWQSKIGYEYARDAAQELNVEIFNATRGGKLEVFPRVDFDSISFEE